MGEGGAVREEKSESERDARSARTEKEEEQSRMIGRASRAAAASAVRERPKADRGGCPKRRPEQRGGNRRGVDAVRAANPMFRRSLRQYSRDGITRLCHVDPFLACQNLPSGQRVPDSAVYEFPGAASGPAAPRDETEAAAQRRRATAARRRLAEPPSYLFSFSAVEGRLNEDEDEEDTEGEDGDEGGGCRRRAREAGEWRLSQWARAGPAARVAVRPVCWWDCNAFDWAPFPLPIEYRAARGLYSVRDDRDRHFEANRVKTLPHQPVGPVGREGKSDERELWRASRYNPENAEYVCVGCFCGPSCAIAYALHERLTHVVPHIYMLARALGYLGTSSELSGLHHDSESGERISAAPPREVLRMFSGREDGLTVEQFREMCACGIEVRVRDPVFVTRLQVVEAEQRVAERAVQSNASGAYHREDPRETCNKSATELAHESTATLKPMHGTMPLSSFFF